MNIVSFSGGKDSTAMLLKMIENKEPIHSIMWFDTERDFPEIINHINKIKKLDINFVRLRHYIGFDFLEKRYGPAHSSGGWCTAAKRDTCNKYIRLIRKDIPDIVECIGFNTDEESRIKKTNKKWKTRFPLFELGMNSNDTLKYCYDMGYDFDGIYAWMPSRRVSCYNCPKQSKKDFEAIKKYHPELKIA